MKRGRKAANQPQEELVKSTYLLQPVLKENIAYVALSEKKDQSDIVREAIMNYLNAKGLKPMESPKFSFAAHS